MEGGASIAGKVKSMQNLQVLGIRVSWLEGSSGCRMLKAMDSNTKEVFT
jgi:ribosome modulation factor